MKMIVLMVLFSTVANPVPHTAHGFKPRPVASMERCLKRRSSMQNYFERNIGHGTKFTVFCVEFNAVGYDDAVDAFKRRIGDPT